MTDQDFASALVATAQRIGADPTDLATVISYETGGTFDPGVWGGAGGRHMGLIQFGPAERERYGAHDGQSAVEQLGAVERYLTDRGFRPGMGILDLYSTINAGRPGRYSASDAGNGGAPGTVADKVRDQFGPHREKAAALLGGSYAPASRAVPVKLAGFGALPEAAVAGAGAPDLTAEAAASLSAARPEASAEEARPEGLLQPRRLAPPQPVPFDPSRIAGLLSRRIPARGRHAVV